MWITQSMMVSHYSTKDHEKNRKREVLLAGPGESTWNKSRGFSLNQRKQIYSKLYGGLI